MKIYVLYEDKLIDPSVDSEPLQVIKQEGNYLAYFVPGRSIYKTGVGSVYESAKIVFGQIKVRKNETIQLQVILDNVPIRGRG